MKSFKRKRKKVKLTKFTQTVRRGDLNYIYSKSLSLLENYGTLSLQCGFEVEEAICVRGEYFRLVLREIPEEKHKKVERPPEPDPEGYCSIPIGGLGWWK